MSTTQYQALAEFRYQIRKFLAFSEEAAREAGLEARQHQLLLAAKGYTGGGGGPTIGWLAERLQIRPHSAVELVDRMAGRGFVRRRAGERDKRQVIVELTPSGEEVLRKLSVEHLAEIRQIGPGLVAALQRILAEI